MKGRWGFFLSFFSLGWGVEERDELTSLTTNTHPRKGEEAPYYLT